jgi:hypothetical protein
VNNYIIDTVEKIARYLSRSRIEPHVEQKCDRSGNIYWQIYDPITGSCCSLSSEQEVKAWLDNRYYDCY